MFPRAVLAAILLSLSAIVSSNLLPIEEIDLDVAPSKRWRSFAQKYRLDIISRAEHLGRAYEFAIGEELLGRWLTSAHVPDELKAEYESLVKYVNHSAVTYERLVITDMWQALNAPLFACTGLLAATSNGTVIHGRNIDYNVTGLNEIMVASGAGVGGSGFFDGVFKRGGRPIVSFIASIGSLGIHTGMRIGSWSFNSNARLFNNKIEDNLRAAEGGGQNFPWVAREVLQSVPDFDSAVQAFETTIFNAPNYFILAGSGPYQGAVITKDRLGTHEPTTPPTQMLNAAAGVWHLVQTNDDLLHPPADDRRGSAIARLSRSRPSLVSVDFVLREMQAPPVTNPETILTWIAVPRSGSHWIYTPPAPVLVQGTKAEVLRHASNTSMPLDISKDHENVAGVTAGARSSLRGMSTLAAWKQSEWHQ